MNNYYNFTKKNHELKKILNKAIKEKSKLKNHRNFMLSSLGYLSWEELIEEEKKIIELELLIEDYETFIKNSIKELEIEEQLENITILSSFTEIKF